MSAIALHDLTAPDLMDRDFPPAPGVRSSGRGHLRLVTADDLPQTGAMRAPAGTPLTLTRRARLLMTLTVAGALVVVIAAAMGVFPAMAAGSHTVVVQPGQTLSHVAVAELPELPMDRAIVQIQLANEMNSLDVQAGTVLQIPQP
ncbi:LysM peptidoglycan-binding domain-containing protein [Ornithinimicrobium cryptoxanthini]|uniref:LysM peptidoglycan-binding domain-containing protein n=1 Tax=Ornithinimicrobium cryptoxanthini TaxID=2934161 RepID=A0ABY4YKX9_9MICO|nr:LysM peptidoglycan-binding domain-containing protein [Ornithinimicrobium cryptoxanthini]USQ77282.1 LysM peptidoglycan-binding domain-containing protein [Ornithinimicrobium cryptoxanthini]